MQAWSISLFMQLVLAFPGLPHECFHVSELSICSKRCFAVLPLVKRMAGDAYLLAHLGDGSHAAAGLPT